MELEMANHPQNKPVLKFDETELYDCASLTQDEARVYLAKSAFASNMPSFNSSEVHCSPEYVPVRNGVLDARPEIALALRERDETGQVLSKYGARMILEGGIKR